jgi:hypothetical protein
MVLYQQQMQPRRRHGLSSTPRQTPSSTFDGLPVRRIRWARRIQGRSIRRQAALALIQVKALDQGDFIWSLSSQVVPSMRL